MFHIILNQSVVYLSVSEHECWIGAISIILFLFSVILYTVTFALLVVMLLDLFKLRVPNVMGSIKPCIRLV